MPPILCGGESSFDGSSSPFSQDQFQSIFIIIYWVIKGLEEVFIHLFVNQLI